MNFASRADCGCRAASVRRNAREVAGNRGSWRQEQHATPRETGVATERLGIDIADYTPNVARTPITSQLFSWPMERGAEEHSDTHRDWLLMIISEKTLLNNLLD